MESLKQVLVEAVDNFPMDVIHAAINARPNRLRAVLGQMVAIFNNFFCIL